MLYACAKAGYVPSHVEELLHLARSAYHKMIARRNYKWALNLMNSLTVLQLFLDKELSKLFTLEALEDLDLYLAGCSTCCNNASNARCEVDPSSNLHIGQSVCLFIFFSLPCD